MSTIADYAFDNAGHVLSNTNTGTWSFSKSGKYQGLKNTTSITGRYDANFDDAAIAQKRFAAMQKKAEAERNQRNSDSRAANTGSDAMAGLYLSQRGKEEEERQRREAAGLPDGDDSANSDGQWQVARARVAGEAPLYNALGDNAKEAGGAPGRTGGEVSVNAGNATAASGEITERINQFRSENPKGNVYDYLRSEYGGDYNNAKATETLKDLSGQMGMDGDEFLRTFGGTNGQSALSKVKEQKLTCPRNMYHG